MDASVRVALAMSVMGATMTACGGQAHEPAETVALQQAAIRQALAIRHRLKPLGFESVFSNGFLTTLRERPRRSSFYVSVGYATDHPFNFCVFVFKSHSLAERYAAKLRTRTFRPNPWEQSRVVVRGAVVYWGAGAGKLIRQPKPGETPKFYGFSNSTFDHMVAVAEGHPS
jgi:hypothetical protein